MNFEFSDDSLDNEILLQVDDPAVNNASHSSPFWEPPASGPVPVCEPPASGLAPIFEHPVSGPEPAPSPTSNLPIGDLALDSFPGERKGETVHSQPAQPGAG